MTPPADPPPPITARRPPTPAEAGDAGPAADDAAGASPGTEAGSGRIRLLIADDQPLIRRALSMMLQAEAGLEVVGVAADGREAIALTGERRPDVIVMDLRMPQIDGVAATREITTRWPGTRVVVLTTFDQDELVFDAIKAGANAYLLKDVEEDEILETIHAVHRGESRLSAPVARKVLEQFRQMAGGASGPPMSAAGSTGATGTAGATGAAGSARAASALDGRPGWHDGPPANPVTAPLAEPLAEPLTDKERRVLNLIAEGLSNKQIAGTVFLAEGTVKNYVSRIMDKLHARSRTELAVRATRRDR